MSAKKHAAAERLRRALASTDYEGDSTAVAKTDLRRVLAMLDDASVHADAAEKEAVRLRGVVRATAMASAAVAERATLDAWRRALLGLGDAEDNERLKRSSMSPMRADYHRRCAAEAEAAYLAARSIAKGVASKTAMRPCRHEAARLARMIEHDQRDALIAAFIRDPSMSLPGTPAALETVAAGECLDAWNRCDAARAALDKATGTAP